MQPRFHKTLHLLKVQVQELSILPGEQIQHADEPEERVLHLVAEGITKLALKVSKVLWCASFNARFKSRVRHSGYCCARSMVAIRD